jgi:hypothetical protein
LDQLFELPIGQFNAICQCASIKPGKHIDQCECVQPMEDHHKMWWCDKILIKIILLKLIAVKYLYVKT